MAKYGNGRSDGLDFMDALADVALAMIDPIVDRKFTPIAEGNRIMVTEVRKSGREDVVFYRREK